ncbi:MAG: energy-coupling factor transporter transmembrane component T [Actinomycetaceae bacterium]|nr:energy-coupling factor transporter transmembrane protein EcfT [Arcanobacterium sp.]MDD7504508.1 energy-coupling factor transporter transmembrane component T [Actinomycetaceae bacterium]MDY6142823.1 energy-coupling factor transporter transmembrane component T [Arcanobacterium sp.]
MDPRTKLLMVIVANVCVMTVVKTPVTLTALAIVATALLVSRKYYVLCSFLALFSMFTTIHFIAGVVPHWLGALLAVIGQYGSRLTVVLFCAVWLFATTTPAAFLAALNRAHVPRAITVPISVMFRYFPAALEEVQSIWAAMRLRGLFSSTGSLVAHPVRAAEYMVVPLVGSTLQIADDLSASAMVRGLGRPERPTSITRIGFGVTDLLGIAACAALIAVFVYTWNGIQL